MSTSRVFTGVVVIGLVLSAINAIAGRALRASPDPSIVLVAAACALTAYRLAAGDKASTGIVAATTMWVSFGFGFLISARMLIGWNGAIAWEPPGTMWVANMVLTTAIATAMGTLVGSRARDLQKPNTP